jgi:tetratricopeptide (TPR) repeat protein
MRVAVYGICKNEIAHAEAYLESCRAADAIFILDTGSTDGSDRAFGATGATVRSAVVEPWRFDVARNQALALVPRDYEVCIALDMDERLVGDWRGELERRWVAGTSCASARTIWDWLPDGRPNCVLWLNRLHAREGYVWRFPCHEALYHSGAGPERTIELQSLEIHQFHLPSKRKRDDLPLLRLGVAENPNSARCSYYLGRELVMRDDYAEALRECHRFLGLPGATWVKERAEVMRFISNCQHGLGNLDAALRWASDAAGADPEQREHWVEVAKLALEQQNWALAYEASKAALAITERAKSFFTYGWAWGSLPWGILAVAAWHLGRGDEAVAACEEAVRLAPDDAELRDNLKLMSA